MVSEKNHKLFVVDVTKKRKPQPKKNHVCKFILQDGNACGKSFRSPSDLRKHDAIHTGVKPFVCKFKDKDGTICNMKFARNWCLKQHKTIHSNQKPFVCHLDTGHGECGKSFKSLTSLKVHAKTHSGLKKYKCDFVMENGNVCNKSFTRSTTLATHQLSHTNEFPYVCEAITEKGQVCGRKFRQLSNFKTHQRVHTKARNYVCDFVVNGKTCGRALASSTSLQEHKLAHVERPFVCNFVKSNGICGRTYKDNQSFEIHTKKHQNVKPFFCNFVKNGKRCGRAFFFESILENHKKTHIGIKKYVCTFVVDNVACGTRFTSHASLKSHQHIHSGVKSFVCNFQLENGICNKAFSQKTGLNMHKRLHGPKNFVCNFQLPSGVCGRAFAFSDKMLLHRMVHTGERPFKCKDEHCEQTFSQSSHANKHFNRWHSPEGILTHQTKEQRLHKIMTDAGLLVERNVAIDYGCIIGATTANATSKVGTRAYLDFVIYKSTHILIIECDEHQHSEEYSPWPYTLSCELARMSQVQTAITISSTSTGTNVVMPIVWIRFNPDKFFIDGVSQGKVMIRSKREKRLLEVIDTFQPNQPVSIIYMFYDCNTVDGQMRPVILDDEDYNEEFAKCVLEPIVE